uniref:Uncharacterized protein n=1 Tax=Helianthus annuus TaxID=4232 RepID=A0A251SU16_HELAN
MRETEGTRKSVNKVKHPICLMKCPKEYTFYIAPQKPCYPSQQVLINYLVVFGIDPA